MKTLRDFQKRRNGTAPTVTGQQRHKNKNSNFRNFWSFLHQREQEEQEEQAYAEGNVDANNRDDINGILSKLEKLLYSGAWMA